MEALRIVQKMVWGPWLLGLFLAVGVLCMVRRGVSDPSYQSLVGRDRLGAAGKDSF